MSVPHPPAFARAIGLSKTFAMPSGDCPAVREVHLELFPGQLTLLMGPSGSGKTTLLSMLAGLMRPTRGRVSLFGCALEAAEETTLARLRRARVGFVFQRDNLFPALTALDNVAEVLRLKGTPAREARARAEAALVEVGLSERLDHHPAQLSGGQRQRVAIARALAGRPSVVFGDELTSALDGRSARAVLELLRAYVSPETAAVIVTHDPRLVPLADRVLHLEDGVLIRDERRAARDASIGGPS